jgi:hypothetical protein
MKAGVLAALLVVGLITAGRAREAQPPAVPILAAKNAGVSAGASVLLGRLAPRSATAPRGGIHQVQPAFVAVDSHAVTGTDSNVNGVFEPGETVQISPFWTNIVAIPQFFTGTATNLTGPPGPTYTIVDATAAYGSIVPTATSDCYGQTGDCYLMTVSGSRPVQHWDVQFTEMISGTTDDMTVWTVHIGESFTDVPNTDPFYAYIETLFHLGITAGCGSGDYCPSSFVTRAQMAVFLLKAEHGSNYVPPTCTGIFGDVTCPSQYADWIEQLSNEGITDGCAPALYCPDNPVTRAQMSVFLLKTEHGSGYLPPACTSLFNDVPCPSLYAAWIQQLYNEGITGGCGGNDYCPDASVTRGQMAVFLVKTLGPPAPPLPTPTPPPTTPTPPPMTPTPPPMTPTPTVTPLFAAHK